MSNTTCLTQVSSSGEERSTLWCSLTRRKTKQTRPYWTSSVEQAVPPKSRPAFSRMPSNQPCISFRQTGLTSDKLRTKQRMNHSSGFEGFCREKVDSTGFDAVGSLFGRADDAVGSPYRAQSSQLELFELILLSKVSKRLPVERLEAAVSQSTAPRRKM